jgi:CheY-like chemotaxis protein
MRSDGRRARVLLVEDNVVNQRVAASLLTRRGHHVIVAADGREALAQLEHQSFEVVLMDLQMPVMSGIEATIAIRKRERVTGRHARIVAMTAHAMSSDRDRCLAAGMDGYLSKPIDAQKLFAAVEDAVDCSMATAAVAAVTFDDEPATSAGRRRPTDDRGMPENGTRERRCDSGPPSRLCRYPVPTASAKIRAEAG